MRLTGKSLILMLLYAPTEGGAQPPIQGRTRLMKMVFLFEKELLDDFRKDRDFDEIALPEFFAWHYGPFSARLLDDLEFLVNRGFVSSEAKGNAVTAELEEFAYWVEDFDQEAEAEYVEEEFSLTAPKGEDHARMLWGSLTDNQQHLLSSFKNSLNGTSLDRILEYVYKKYQADGYTDRSLVRDRYLA